ncbi:MAG: hypothetical protein IKR92_01755 [Alphaproteobacteria bacterium]|nr:hypothetical protein [Alphaproteobacteria bacterium]
MKTEKTKATKKKSVRSSAGKKEIKEKKSVSTSSSKKEIKEKKSVSTSAGKKKALPKSIVPTDSHATESVKKNKCCIRYKCIVMSLIIIGIICGACVYGKRIIKSAIDYITPYVWQITADYEGESVCLMYMQDEETIADNKDKMIQDIKKTKQTCKCLHNIAVKNGVTDFGNFIKVISEEGKLTKDWMHKKIDGEETDIENSYIKTWMEFWLKEKFTDCE